MSATRSTPNAAAIAAHLEERAGDYYVELQGKMARARLERSSLRPFSELYEFELRSGSVAPRVFVKIPFLDKSRPPVDEDRPRLFPPVVPQQMASLEYDAMQLIRRRLASETRFGSVRVLDLLHHPDALVMAKVEGTTLRSSTAMSGNNDDSRSTFQNVGTWLRCFHQLPNLSHTQERSQTRDDFIEGTERFLSYLTSVNAPRWMGSLGEVLIREGASTLPPQLPTGLAHGDFAPRNVIVSSDHRITVLDTLARWRAPIYEDIALFLLSLRLRSGVKALWSTDSPALTRSSRAFLRGYFGESRVDLPVIRLFILQALLDRGCSYVSRPATNGLMAAFKRSCKLHLLKRLASYFLSSDSPYRGKAAEHPGLTG